MSLDVLWWWGDPDSYGRRPGLLTAIWHAFLIFIIFNATVVFKTGLLRWLGVGLCLAVGLVWLVSFRSRLQSRSDQILKV